MVKRIESSSSHGSGTVNNRKLVIRQRPDALPRNVNGRMSAASAS
jgi:hypothetical protein